MPAEPTDDWAHNTLITWSAAILCASAMEKKCPVSLHSRHCKTQLWWLSKAGMGFSMHSLHTVFTSSNNFHHFPSTHCKCLFSSASQPLSISRHWPRLQMQSFNSISPSCGHDSATRQTIEDHRNLQPTEWRFPPAARPLSPFWILRNKLNSSMWTTLRAKIMLRVEDSVVRICTCDDSMSAQ